MVLEALQDEAVSLEMADEAIGLMTELFPICRSLAGEGNRRTLDALGQVVPLERIEVPSGTPIFDWETPSEWNVRAAHVTGPDGRRVVDFADHTLHLVGCSIAVDRTLTLDELQPHLHSIPQHPDWIPYRTSYWREDWGFCLAHRVRAALTAGRYRVLIDADLSPGSMSLAESVIPGRTDGEALVHTHCCHPSLANDNLSGMAVSALIARALHRERPRLGWRFVIAPGTVGSLAWLSMNRQRFDRLQAGLVIGLLGDAGPLAYKRSRCGATPCDRAVEFALAGAPFRARMLDFEPYGYDERQYCSPGIDLPVGRITRSANGGYPQYHTSADDLSLIDRDALAESIRAVARAISVLDANRRLQSLVAGGEPRLGKRGLYGAVGGTGPDRGEHALLWTASLADGNHDLVSIARRSGFDFELTERAASALEEAMLVRSLAVTSRKRSDESTITESTA